MDYTTISDKLLNLQEQLNIIRNIKQQLLEKMELAEDTPLAEILNRIHPNLDEELADLADLVQLITAKQDPTIAEPIYDLTEEIDNIKTLLSTIGV